MTSSLRLPADWNRERKLEREVLDRLGKASFEIDLGDGYWGSGFFFAPDLAFTADHNPRPSGRHEFHSFFQGNRITFKWIEEWSSEDADIAVLRLIDNPSNVQFDTLPVRYLNPLISDRERDALLVRRKVAIHGFAVSGPGQIESHVIGLVDDTRPLGWQDDKDDAAKGGIRTRRLVLNIHGNKSGVHITGMSGAPIWDFDWECVVGVERSCTPGGQVVHGSLMYEWLGRLLRKGIDCAELRAHVKDLFGEVPEPSSGIALPLRDGQSPAARVAPVSVRFSAGGGTSGVIAGSNGVADDVARSAVEWAGNFLRRMSGALRHVIDENYWGTDCPYNFATFDVRHTDSTALQSDAEMRDVLHAALALAYLARVLRDTVVHDLRLPLDFPQPLIVCSAGFAANSPQMISARDWIRVIERHPFSGPARVLYARWQQAELAQVPLALDSRVKLIPIDQPEDMARDLLSCLLDDTRSQEVAQHLQARFVALLEKLLEQELTVKRARLAAQGREAELSELQQELAVRKKEADYLAEKNAAIITMAATGKSLPPVSAVAEELGALRERWMAEAGLVVLIEPSNEREEQELERCKRLRRRIATFVHPDKAMADLPVALQFTTLNDHSQDLLYLRGMEAALDPLGSPPFAPAIEDAVSRWIDRLFELREIEVELHGKIGDISEEAASYGEEWKQELDETLEAAQRAVRVQTSFIDALWWELRWRVGREPVGHDEGELM